AFRRGVNNYLQAHAYGNATSQDFWTAISDASGKSVDRILPSFINQPGAPLLEVSLSCVNGRSTLDVSQQRFFQDPAAASTRSPERWQIPVCVKTAGTGGGCDLIADNKQALSLGNSCVPWAFVNAGAQGYYRTAYSADMLRALAPRIQESLSPPERVSLAGDEWAMVRAGRDSAANYLTLVRGYANEHVNGVLDGITGRLEMINDYVTTAESQPRFQRFVRDLFSPLFQEIGFTSTAVDSDERRALRATLIHTLGDIGEDPAIASRARAALDRALAGSQPLDPTLASSIVSVSARHGDAALFDALLAAAERSSSGDEKYRYLYALGKFRDPKLIERALEYSLTSRLRTQDTASFYRTLLEQAPARAQTWTFMQTHWPEIEPKIRVFEGDTTITSALGNFCDAAHRDEVNALLKAHPTPGRARTLSQTDVTIHPRRQLRKAQTATLAQFLGK